MRAGVFKAFSKFSARTKGVGRQILYTSRTGSGISIQRSRLISWAISAFEKIGSKSEGESGCFVPGCSGGGSGVGRSA